jgi:hypothetical protein
MQWSKEKLRKIAEADDLHVSPSREDLDSRALDLTTHGRREMQARFGLRV